MSLEELIEDKVETVLWVGDQHSPYHDRKTHRTILNFMKYLNGTRKWDHLVLGGDLLDFYSVSSFDKDPSRANRLQWELDMGRRVLEEYREAMPKTDIKYLEGNHEERLIRYLKKHPELYDLRALQIPNLLDLKGLDIAYMHDWFYKGFLFKHGDYANKYAANKELEVEGVNGMSGHTHRNDLRTKNTRGGYYAWHNIGHTCDESKADYISGVPNWQQGIGIVYFEKGRSKRYNAHMIPIIEHKFIFEGITFQPKMPNLEKIINFKKKKIK